MRRMWTIALLVLISIAPASALAGEGGCKGSTQDCLNKMAAELRDRGWVGLELDHGASGEMTVQRVVEDSPAAAAGFRPGDVLVAVNGVEFSEYNQEALSKIKQTMRPGKQVTYTVARDGAKRDVDVTLAKVPDQVLAAWIGGHMLEAHTTVASASGH